MDHQNGQGTGGVWELVRQQHGVISTRQLHAFGFGPDAIKHRVAKGRLHPVLARVYAVGRPRLTQHGRWMAAVLSCGPGAALSHQAAGALWQIAEVERGLIQVSVSSGHPRGGAGVVVHRRPRLEVVSHEGIPVTNPVHTLVDLAACIERGELEAAINQADRLDLVSPEQVRSALAKIPRRPGLGVLRELLDRQTFVVTDSELERLFVPIASAAGLPRPETGVWLNGFKVDFYWPALGLVVETDGLRYHRTASQQAADRRRDQTHTAAGLIVLRFTHAQVNFEPGYVRDTLAAVIRIRP